MDFKTSIVIPVYKNADLLINILGGLWKYERDGIDELIVVDDASEDIEITDAVNEAGLAGLPIKTLINKRNIGFTLSANKGLRATYREVGERRSVFLISSDVSINGKFIDQANDLIFGARRTLVGHKLLFGNTGWNKFGDKVFEYLEGYFLACTSDGWRDLGYFDVNYAPHDFEDVDLSTHAKRSGYKLEALNNPVIVHKGGGSIGYSKEREEITNRNREYFRSKWVK